MRLRQLALILPCHVATDATSAPDLGAALSLPSTKSSNDQSLGTSRFEAYGPTISVTLSDPIASNTPSTASLVSNERSMSIGRQYEGLAAKLAARFRLSSASSIAGDTAQMPSEFSDGYMIDDGNVMLRPPSECHHDQSVKHFFPLFGGLGPMIRPELTYEIGSKKNQTPGVDNRPFPFKLPWVNAVSCGIKWRPYSTYKQGEGYGHKLMSTPHFMRCGASVALPKSDSGCRKSITTNRRTLDLDVSYLGDGSQGGRIEVLIGKISPYLMPKSTDHQQNNHLLACFAINKPHASKASSLEYLRGSIGVSLPAFLRKKCTRILLSPSYDFVNDNARLVASGAVGLSGQTSVILRLDSDDSTLTVTRALDER